MGCADVVPGVSGGTVALILGIYIRLVTAISHVDRSLWHMLLARKWSDAAEYLDLRFLVGLATGIVTGIVGMSLIINRLLTDSASRSFTLAVFFGMIGASAVILAKMIKPDTGRQRAEAILTGVVAASFACWASFLHHNSSTEPSLAWLFACGSIAICAMILPGISGAMILLVLGVYVHLTEIPKNLLAGVAVVRSLQELFVFACGCGISLVAFSKVLRWLLTTWHTRTMAALCGFMIGALPKLWPFQTDLSLDVEKFKHKKFSLDWPTTLDGQTIAVTGLMVGAAVFVFVVDRWVNRSRKPSIAI